MQYLDAISKKTEWSLHFQGKSFNITIIQVYSPTSNAEEAEVKRFYEDWQDLLELTPKKDVLFIIGDWNAKSRKSRNTWSNSQIWPWSTEWRGQRLTKFCQENTLVTANTLFQQHNFTHWHYQMVNTKIRLIIFFAAKDGEALYSQQKQDQELTVAQIMNSLLPNSDLNLRK